MKNAFILFLILFSSICRADFSTLISDKDLSVFVPDELKKDSDGDLQSLGNGIRAAVVSVRYGNGINGLVVQFRSDDQKCRLIALRKMKGSFSVAGPTVIKDVSDLNECVGLLVFDLDQNGTDEVVVTRMDMTVAISPLIFSWIGGQLRDVTPRDGEYEVLRTVTFVDKPVRGKIVIFDEEPDVSASKLRIYKFEGGKVVLDGEFDSVTYAAPTVGNAPVVINPTFPAAGTYVLNVKNVSDNLNRAVRAEIFLNGSLVLKPQDFCESMQPAKTDKKAWMGHDDDSDSDIDHLKRCKAKKDVYAIVNVKQTNELKIKVFGPKDSKIQVSLTKK